MMNLLTHQVQTLAHRMVPIQSLPLRKSRPKSKVEKGEAHHLARFHQIRIRKKGRGKKGRRMMTKVVIDYLYNTITY